MPAYWFTVSHQQCEHYKHYNYQFGTSLKYQTCTIIVAILQFFSSLATEQMSTILPASLGDGTAVVYNVLNISRLLSQFEIFADDKAEGLICSTVSARVGKINCEHSCESQIVT